MLGHIATTENIKFITPYKLSHIISGITSDVYIGLILLQIIGYRPYAEHNMHGSRRRASIVLMSRLVDHRQCPSSMQIAFGARFPARFHIVENRRPMQLAVCVWISTSAKKRNFKSAKKSANGCRQRWVTWYNMSEINRRSPKMSVVFPAGPDVTSTAVTGRCNTADTSVDKFCHLTGL